MSETFIKEVEHVAVEPVRIEREHNDVIVIEGVRYAGDYFRTMAVPDADVLYAVRRDDEDRVVFTVIRNVEEAEAFFDYVFLAEAMDPSATPLSMGTSTSPQMREERANLGGEIRKEIDNAI